MIEGQLKEINLVCECLKWDNVINKIFNCDECNNTRCVVKNQIKDKIKNTSNPIGCVNCNKCENENCNLFEHRAENRAKELCDYFKGQEQYINEENEEFGRLSIYK